MESPQGRKKRRLNSGPLKLETFANAKTSKYNIKELSELQFMVLESVGSERWWC